uniref:Uncharacterized protein n=1 Tax=Pleurostichidium falkenbergii TaxID=121064 RepID=A0A4D6UY42_9FLOR|nr:hypothetical protein [Pleurostichidium falkenbergii]QCH39578.1 hypothetical protein [Pleurostichidium falkenbergii]
MYQTITLKYWPNETSIKLNNAVVDLFIETEKKLLLKTNNKSNQYLYLDILNINNKNRLLRVILNQFKELVLDIIEINLSSTKVMNFSKKIWEIFIERASKKFLLQLEPEKNIAINKNHLSDKNNNLIDHLLIYLVFGSKYIQDDIFMFDKLHTPYNHIKILLENFIIIAGDIIMEKIIQYLNDSTNINKFLKKNNLCNKLYISKRSTILFLNNLKWQNLIESQVYATKYFYNERQKVCIISSKGIIKKYIYVSENRRKFRLNRIKIVFLFWLEVKDLIIPKIEKFIVQVAKYFLYCSINLFSNLILILIRIIVFYLNKYN